MKTLIIVLILVAAALFMIPIILRKIVEHLYNIEKNKEHNIYIDYYGWSTSVSALRFEHMSIKDLRHVISKLEEVGAKNALQEAEKELAQRKLQQNIIKADYSNLH